MQRAVPDVTLASACFNKLEEVKDFAFSSLNGQGMKHCVFLIS